MRTWSWMWCEHGADALIFCSSCHSCVHAVFFLLSGENVAFLLCRKSESSSELFLHTILQTCRKKLFVCFYRSSVSDAAFSSDSSDLYDFHLSFVFPCFHPPNTCFLSASSHFSPLLSLIFSISAPESASFSPRHVLPLTKPLVMLQRKSRLFSWNLQSDIFFVFPSGLSSHRCEVLLFWNHASTFWFISSKRRQKLTSNIQNQLL